nr:AraC family transcriptional regulator [Pedobacter panaciterrae]
MGFTFEGSDFSDFLASSSLSGGEVFQTGDEEGGQIKLETPKGQILYHEYLLRENLSILQGNYSLNDDITIFGHGESHLLELHFNLSAHDIYYANNAIKREIAPSMTGNITFLNAEENKARISFNKHVPYHTFDIHLPVSFLTNYSGESRTMDDFLDHINKNLSRTLSKDEIKVSPKIFSAIHAIKNCAYQGLTRKIFLESKIYELIAFANEDSEGANIDLKLTASDIECIKYAALLIRENLDSPATIIELARKVGINQTKLKSGFKRFFGNTVFGYLQETRMERARSFLLDTSLTIQEISNLSGYQNISNFSLAFKNTYGYPPNKLRSRP